MDIDRRNDAAVLVLDALAMPGNRYGSLRIGGSVEPGEAGPTDEAAEEQQDQYCPDAQLAARAVADRDGIAPLCARISSDVAMWRSVVHRRASVGGVWPGSACFVAIMCLMTASRDPTTSTLPPLITCNLSTSSSTSNRCATHIYVTPRSRILRIASIRQASPSASSDALGSSNTMIRGDRKKARDTEMRAAWPTESPAPPASM